MDDDERLAERFEEHRAHLRAVAYRLLGSFGEADDAVQDTWLRLDRTGADGIDNLGGWLTTVVSRICLNMLRSRSARPQEALGVHLPDPVIGPDDASGPEGQALLADSVGMALFVVLDTLSPAQRLAFVLHDLFDLSFDEIAPMVDRSPAAARQLASRARRRVRGTATDGFAAPAAPAEAADPAVRRRVVDAFFAAARRGDFAALVALLDPDVVLRADGGVTRPEASVVLRGAAAVARRALLFAQPAAVVSPVLVNGDTGVIVAAGGQRVSVMGFVIVAGRIAAIHAWVAPERLARFRGI
ncbi:sigma-70 family RNA polymerase sigma factor [Candidatus Frankia alpina]|uniref:Sigma-70 family RNA polymerase sigma factor n=1 Tax=Candidatus Frankia alpina TaxID=2699483 RepID=A0A4S5EBD5_9ACTN|nr:sigma-70 family RNA polymerase sigma factor [Candidatus Frankia alpina]THJ69087.1 sigma-70 family RNA polymerase sigma factor [Candidatus Frankia alpina]